MIKYNNLNNHGVAMDFTLERSVFLNDEINARTSMEAIMGISKLYIDNPNLVITLFIASNGGSVDDSFATYDYMMNALKPKLQTVALGEVSSSAVPLFLMGELRYIANLALIRFHRFSLGDARNLTSKNAKEIGKDLDRSEAKYVNLLRERTSGKITEEMANTLLDNRVAVMATQAVELGLAHHIL
jgi:ATP-dependent protease ClpP protease subunit